VSRALRVLKVIGVERLSAKEPVILLPGPTWESDKKRPQVRCVAWRAWDLEKHRPDGGSRLKFAKSLLKHDSGTLDFNSLISLHQVVRTLISS
jgi:hypothetical protein